jgi:NDP-sugar pyrophosphorylase family protein
VSPELNPELSNDAEGLFALVRSLWTLDADHPLAALLPHDPDSLRTFYPRLREHVTHAPRARHGTIDPAAIVQGEIVSMGEGSVIEAGAIVHSSCRLILGARSIVRAGAVLRDEVIVGDDCLIGVHCEVVRSVIIGPRTQLGHFIYLADSVLGGNVMVAGNVWVANTTIKGGETVPLVYRDRKIDSGRTHLGMLAGDGVRIAASTTVCPGCLVLPNLTLPPSITLYGTIDSAKRHALMKHFIRTWVTL